MRFSLFLVKKEYTHKLEGVAQNWEITSVLEEAAKTSQRKCDFHISFSSSCFILYCLLSQISERMWLYLGKIRISIPLLPSLSLSILYIVHRNFKFPLHPGNFQSLLNPTLALRALHCKCSLGHSKLHEDRNLVYVIYHYVPSTKEVPKELTEWMIMALALWRAMWLWFQMQLKRIYS